MSDGKDGGNPKKGITRRDFLTTGIGAAVGAGAFGVLPQLLNSKNLGVRTPAARGSVRRSLITPLHEMRPTYKVVVIGSGYGASILAARLAAKEKSICILERGKEWLPGDFPTTEMETASSLRTSISPLGFIDINAHARSDLDIVMGSGLGGTSLLNAAITIRPEDLVFKQKEWPREIRAIHENGVLGRYFARAEGILAPNRSQRTQHLLKVKSLASTVRSKGVPFGELALNINHKPQNTNAQGAYQEACTDCGNCCGGCNVGAKNTLSTNYLSMAHRKGVQIFTQMEVTHIEKDATGEYVIHYLYYDNPSGTSSDHQYKGSVRAQKVILGAGSMGSTEILLRSRSSRFTFSSLLGTRLSANADVLGFAYNGRTPTNIVAYQDNKRLSSLGQEGAVGQTITAYGDYRKANGGKNRLEERFLFLDGAIPTALVPLVARTLGAFGLTQLGKYPEQDRPAVMNRIWNDLKANYPGKEGALNHSMMYLACGHDSASGRYELASSDDRVHTVWPRMNQEPAFQNINREMAEHAQKLGALFIRNPRSTIFGGGRLMATHPLGGCPMGDDVGSGAVNHKGQVFDESGSVHAGLYVVDSAIIPRSLGATPLITISALAERIADLIIQSDYS